MWEALIWTIIAGFFALGIWAIDQTSPYFMLSRVCFILVALIFLARLSWWIGVEQHFSNKFLMYVVVVVIYGATGTALIYGLVFLSDLEHKFKELNIAQVIQKPLIKPSPLIIRSLMINQPYSKALYWVE